VPKFEKLAAASLMSVAPTVMALATRAATACTRRRSSSGRVEYDTPEADRVAHAWSNVAEAPRQLMFATAGRQVVVVTQSTPEITPEVVPDPLQRAPAPRKPHVLGSTP